MDILDDMGVSHLSHETFAVMHTHTYDEEKNTIFFLKKLN